MPFAANSPLSVADRVEVCLAINTDMQMHEIIVLVPFRTHSHRPTSSSYAGAYFRRSFAFLGSSCLGKGSDPIIGYSAPAFCPAAFELGVVEGDLQAIYLLDNLVRHLAHGKLLDSIREAGFARANAVKQR